MDLENKKNRLSHSLTASVCGVPVCFPGMTCVCVCVCVSAKTHIELFCMTAKVNKSRTCVHCRLAVSNRPTFSVFNACESLRASALRCICRCVPRLFLRPDVLPPLFDSPAATQIFPETVPFKPFAKKKKKKKNCTSRPQQKIWADKISLDYKAHFTVSLTLDTLALGLVRHADGNGDGAAVPSLPIIVCGICERALAGSLRHDELRLHLPPMIALWTEYNRRFPNHWSDGTL